MKRTLSSFVALDAFADGRPPSEFCLFKAGLNRTLKGDFTYSGRSAKECAEFSSSRTVQCVIDYEHASLKAKDSEDPAESGKAAGWFSVEARPEGVFAVGVTWTKRAAEFIAAREYRYFSPVVFFDGDTREITAIFNAALTNNPATMDQEPLVASASVCTDPPQEPSMKTLLALLSLPLDATEDRAVAKLEELKASAAEGRAQLLSVTGRSTTPEALGVIAAWKESAGKVEALAAELEAIKAKSKSSEVEALVASAISNHKATPAQKDFLTRMGSRDLAELRAFIEASPKIVSGKVEQPKAPPVEASLTAEDKEVSALLGTSLSDLAAFKAKIAAV